MSELNVLPFNSSFSQGATADWSNTNRLYYTVYSDTSFRGQLYTVNQVNRNVTLVNTIGMIIDGPGPVITGARVRISDIAVSPVPEPSTVAVTGLGLSGLVAWARRKRPAVASPSFRPLAAWF